MSVSQDNQIFDKNLPLPGHCRLNSPHKAPGAFTAIRLGRNLGSLGEINRSQQGNITILHFRRSAWLAAAIRGKAGNTYCGP